MMEKFDFLDIKIRKNKAADGNKYYATFSTSYDNYTSVHHKDPIKAVENVLEFLKKQHPLY